MAQGSLIQNKNLAGKKLNVRGNEMEIDEDGVLACSSVVAKLLVGTPGWSEYKPNEQMDLQEARNKVLTAEAVLKKAERDLESAEKDLDRREKMVDDYKKHDGKDMDPEIPPEVLQPGKLQPPAPEPNDLRKELNEPSDEGTGESASGGEEEIDENEFPTMQSTKDDIIAFCAKHDIAYDPNGTKADLLKTIEADTE